MADSDTKLYSFDLDNLFLTLDSELLSGQICVNRKVTSVKKKDFFHGYADIDVLLDHVILQEAENQEPKMIAMLQVLIGKIDDREDCYERHASPRYEKATLTVPNPMILKDCRIIPASRVILRTHLPVGVNPIYERKDFLKSSWLPLYTKRTDLSKQIPDSWFGETAEKYLAKKE